MVRQGENMRKAEVSFNIIIPDEASPEQVQEFIKFGLQINGVMSRANPIQEFDNLKPYFLTIREFG